MPRARVFNWLRIAIGWGSLITALLIAGLWIRSTFYLDAVRVPLAGGRIAHLSSSNGQLLYCLASSQPPAKLDLQSQSIDLLAEKLIMITETMVQMAYARQVRAEANLNQMQFQAILRQETTDEVAPLQREISDAESQIAEVKSLLTLYEKRDGWMMANSLLGLTSDGQRPKQYLGFGVLRTSKLLVMELPNWFVVSLCTAIAAITLLRLRPRFSLRTFLTAATLFAVALGIAAARNQQ